MAEKINVPEIRFAGFVDPWEQRKLGDCFEFLKNNTLSRACLNGENGTARNIHYGDILIKFGDCLDGEQNDLPFITDDTVLPKFAGSILREGDVIFADTAEDEAAGKCVELRKLPKEPTVSGLHTIPARPRFPFGTGYLGHYLNSDAFHRQLLPLMQGIKVISVSKAALQDTQVRFPSLSEQTAIGVALSEIDNLITLHQRKHDKLAQLKKSMLDKMFPKPGEQFPEIRFAGFTDPWEQRKFGELYRPVTEKNDLSFGRDRIISVANMYFNSAVYVTEDSYLATYNVMRLGDIAFEGNRSKRFAHGRFVENTIGDGIVSHVFKVFRPVGNNYDLAYWKHAINNEKLMKDALTRSTKASTMMHELVSSDFLEESTLVPSLDEQRAIGTAIDSIDNLITLHQRKLELLRNTKKSLLDRMFV